MNTPKGMRCFYPDDASTRQEVIERIESVVRRFNFDRVFTPSVDFVESYIEKSGEEIMEELFLVESEGPDLTLTPELTPLTASMVASREKALKKPIKWFSTQRLWRYEQVQQGRFREFWQTNVDIFGSEEPFAELQLLALIVQAFEELGVSSEDVSIVVSDRRVLEYVVREFAEDNVEEIIRLIDKKEKLEDTEFLSQLEEAGVEDPVGLDSIVSGSMKDASSFVSNGLMGPLESLFDRCESIGIDEWVEFDCSVARGLDYYEGIVFEAFDSTEAVSRSLLGGGRYDGLLRSYGSELDAVGFAIGYEPLEVFLDSLDISFVSEEPLVFVNRFEETSALTDELSDKLRRSGYTVESAKPGSTIRSQFERADKIGADYVLLVGSDEKNMDEATVQDMETGEEVKQQLNEVLQGRLDLSFSSEKNT